MPAVMTMVMMPEHTFEVARLNVSSQGGGGDVRPSPKSAAPGAAGVSCFLASDGTVADATG
jgi:hypothetical protein